MPVGKKRTREQKPKTKTFTGWERRFPPDKRSEADPLGCSRCQKAGLPCEGYDVKLYWITDEDTVAPSAIKRHAVSLEGSRAWSFPLGDIDQQLADIDACGEGRSGELPISTGPFGVFYAREPVLRAHDAATLDNDESTPSTETIVQEYHPSESDNYSKDDVLDPDTPTTISSPAKSNWLLQQISSTREASPCVYELHSGIFHDPIIDQLMENYVRNVANVLPPLPHPENPYSSIYVPRAMAGASNLILGLNCAASEMPSSNVAIFYALLATSAFHLRGSGMKRVSGFDVVARRFRAKAFASLQKALQEPYEMDERQALYSPSTPSTSHCEAVISAMLTLITMDVMEGSMSEYWIHLDGVDRVARQLRTEAQESPIIERLITISSFLSTVANTTSMDLPSIPWPDNNVATPGLRYPKSGVGHGLEFTYGITPTLANLMQRIVALSQHISYYVSNSTAFPPSLVSACLHLSDNLSRWSIDAEPLSHLFSDTDTDVTALLAKNHILAFAHGLRVYYHTRILSCTPSDMALYLDRVANYLIDIEEIKTRAGYDSNIAATITWPGFIASCEAKRGPQRDVWYRWWNGMLKYRIGNIAQLWNVVQEAWALRDEEGVTEVPAWMPVLRRSGKRILAV
ncbi:uncharacterized protein Z518_06701 [Rhinocladiella mackenziei CBS 650.93]|uniref:Zn(2)-C6 fungal-type domain-containing protein n=1 Tax=Rhinocladiella mackenziei CBS 650.93 TaxID=1442369 RepID=A0A0D2J2J2_9EURO|nr:uncharacterized protein Z518_06701 [Rhinocladiella mackenziei CBS 650.93]KIX03150.1 hypothetical protein Z518_06701 [Rhinocladiella mackenziei CBS 650.93]